MIRVRKGDRVLVIAGNDKGKTGQVVRVQREAERVVVEGINLRWKHKRPTQQSPKGERVQEACSIHASNVMPLDASGKPTRKRREEEKKKK